MTRWTGEQGRHETVFQGRNYAVLGLPFFHETGKAMPTSRRYSRIRR